MLGIDPGLGFSGYGIAVMQGGKFVLIDHGLLKLPSSRSLVDRVGMFFDFFCEKIVTYQVTSVALETPFLGKNAQNFLKLGYLRGVTYTLAYQNKLVLHEFSPREVKQALTGFGGADKEQVARVIMRLFPLIQAPNRYDITDAIAVTLCGLWRSQACAAVRSL